MRRYFDPDRDGLWWLVLLLYAILLTSLHMAMSYPWRLASFDKLIAFEAAEPFQHRVLVPAIVAGIKALLPLGEELLFALCEVIGWVALLLVAYRFLELLEIGRTRFTRRLLVFTLVIPMAFHLFIPNLVVTPLFDLEAGTLELGTWRAEALYYYSYDLPAALFTLTLVMFLLRFARTGDSRWLKWYLLLFAVATLNRETTVFLIPVFAAVCYGILERGPLLRALLAQAAIFVLLQGLLQWMFSDNVNPNASVPGTHYENHLLANLSLFLNPLYTLTFLARFGGGLYLPVLLLRHHLDPVLGRTLLLFGVPFLAFVVLFGRFQEQRVFIELVPLIWIGGIQTLAAWYAGHRPQPDRP